MVFQKSSTAAVATALILGVLFPCLAFCERAGRDPEPSPINFASVADGASAANGVFAFLVNEGGVRERLFLRNAAGLVVAVEAADPVAKLSFDRLTSLSIADDGSSLLVAGVIPGEGELPLLCKLVGKPSCQLVRIDGTAAREARFLDGGSKILAIPHQEDGDFESLGVVLIDASTGSLRRVGRNYYVERVLDTSRSSALLKVAEVHDGQPRFGISRVSFAKNGDPVFERLLPEK